MLAPQAIKSWFQLQNRFENATHAPVTTSNKSPLTNKMTNLELGLEAVKKRFCTQFSTQGDVCIITQEKTVFFPNRWSCRTVAPSHDPVPVCVTRGGI